MVWIYFPQGKTYNQRIRKIVRMSQQVPQPGQRKREDTFRVPQIRRYKTSPRLAVI